MNASLEGALRVRRGASAAPDVEVAVEELHRAIWQPDIEAVIVFASTHYSPKDLNRALTRAFPDTLVIGCTGAGQIGPGGYEDGGLVGTSLAGDGIWVRARAIEGLRDFQADAAVAEILGLRDEAAADGLLVTPERCFGLLFVDGTSAREEVLLGAVNHGLGSIPLVGGSAGDDAERGVTSVFANGEVLTEGAVVALVHTTAPFRCVKHQNYACGAEPMVVTDAEPKARVVREINGLPAAREYARLHDIDVDPNDPGALMLHPCAFRVGDQLYLRSVLEARPDGSLRFAAAIDIGVILYPATPLPIAKSLAQTFAQVTAEIGAPAVTIAMDCVCRRLAMQAAGATTDVARLLDGVRAVGFASNGEQFNTLQVNMTLTAVLFGQPGE